MRQTQTDTTHSDTAGVRFTTPVVFKAPVAVRVGTAEGGHRGPGGDRDTGQKIRIENVPEPPTMVVFDDENAVLKTLSFHQPTPWLANLLHRHPNLWNRSWAIGQLASRRGDTLAGAALAHAVANADYDLTRAEAATALARFPAERALPALEAAMADTSARVRLAAVQGSGQLGDPRGADLVQRAWAEDPSDQVRAAALRPWPG